MGRKNLRADHLRFKYFTFLAPRRPAEWPGWALLLIGAITVAFAAQRWLEARDQQILAETHLQTRLALAPQERAVKPVVEITPEMETKNRERQQIVTALHRDWQSLYGVLEEAQGNDIALLGIQPDARRGTVVITGEARNLPAVMTYQQRLAARLADVVLTTHEIQQQNPQQPVRFTVNAHWGKGEAQ